MAVHLGAPDHVIVNPDRVEAHFFCGLGGFDNVFNAGKRTGIWHSHAKRNLVHDSLLFLFSDFDLVVLEVAVVPVDDIGRDIVEVVIIDAVVGGLPIEHQLFRLAGLFV